MSRYFSFVTRWNVSVKVKLSSEISVIECLIIVVGRSDIFRCNFHGHDSYPRFYLSLTNQDPRERGSCPLLSYVLSKVVIKIYIYFSPPLVFVTTTDMPCHTPCVVTLLPIVPHRYSWDCIGPLVRLRYACSVGTSHDSHIIILHYVRQLLFDWNKFSV